MALIEPPDWIPYYKDVTKMTSFICILIYISYAISLKKTSPKLLQECINSTYYGSMKNNIQILGILYVPSTLCTYMDP